MSNEELRSSGFDQFGVDDLRSQSPLFLSSHYYSSFRAGHKVIFCHVSFADNSVKQIEICRNSKGEECFHKVCKLIGVIEEAEYFGLQYRNCAGDILWLNLRNRLSKQVPGNPPYSLHFRVKFYVEPYRLQLESTRHQFYFNVALQIKLGFWTTNVPRDVLAELLALIAQIEFKDFHPVTSPCKYSCLWPDSKGEIPMEMVRKIAQQHETLQNIPTHATEYMLCAKAAERLELYGAFFYDVKDLNFQRIHFGVSPSGTYLCSQDGAIIDFFPFCRIHIISDRSKAVYMSLYQDDGSLQDVGFQLSTKEAATSLYRCITEMRLFNHSSTVDQCFLEEMTKSSSLFGGFRGAHAERDYVYDIRMTSREVLDHAKRKLRKTSSQCNANPQQRLQNADANASITATHGGDSAQGQIISHRLVGYPSTLSNTDTKQSGRARLPIGKAFSESHGANFSCGSAYNNINAHVSHGSTPDSLVQKICDSSACQSDDVTELHMQLERWEDAVLCRICMDKRSSRIFLPCGHAITCSACSKRFTTCPICRQNIETVHVFYAPWDFAQSNLYYNTRESRSSPGRLSPNNNCDGDSKRAVQVNDAGGDGSDVADGDGVSNSSNVSHSEDIIPMSQPSVLCVESDSSAGHFLRRLSSTPTLCLRNGERLADVNDNVDDSVTVRSN